MLAYQDLGIDSKTQHTFVSEKPPKKFSLSQYRDLVPTPIEGITVEKGGFTPDVAQLAAMKSDISVVAYEFLQNLSYGLDFDPPPIILLKLKTGEKVAVTGIESEWPDFSSIESCQFITACKEGITQSQATINQRDDVNKGLGHFGLGLKHAAAYLLSEKRFEGWGVAIDINSSYTHGVSGQRCNWVGRYSMDTTIDGKTKQLNIHWKDFDGKLDQTIVSIHNPPTEFLESLKTARQNFLPLNPDYRGGLFVPGNRNRNEGVRLCQNIGGLAVEVLDEKLLGEDGPPYKHGFVDGTRFTIDDSYKNLLFPWHFVGGLGDGVDNWVRISRDSDSRAVRNIENLPKLLRQGLQNEKLGTKFWEELLDRMYLYGCVEGIGQEVQKPEGYHIENALELAKDYGERDLRLEAKAILQKAWDNFARKHPDIQAINDDRDIREIRESYAAKRLPQKYNVLTTFGLTSLLNQLDKKPIALRDLHGKHLVEAARAAEPIDRFNMNPVIEIKKEGGMELNLYTAIEELGKHEGIKFDRNEGGFKLTFSRDIGYIYFAGSPEKMFPQNETVRRALVETVKRVGDIKGNIDGKYFEGGSDEATFNLKYYKPDETTLQVLASGEVRDTFVENTSGSRLELTFKIQSTDIAQELEVKFMEGKRALELARNDETNEQMLVRQLRETEREKERAAGELAQLKGNIAAEVGKAVVEEKKVLAQTKARVEKDAAKEMEELAKKKEEADRLIAELRAEKVRVAAARREAFNLMLKQSTKAIVAVGGGTVAFLKTAELVRDHILMNPAVANGLAIVGNKLHEIGPKISIPTIAGEMSFGLNAKGKLRPNWLDSAKRVAIDSGESKFISAAQVQVIRRENGFDLPEDQVVTEKPSLALVYVEGMIPSDDTAGFYQTSFSNKLSLNRIGNVIEGDYVGADEFRTVNLPKGRPQTYNTRQVYKARIPTNWAPLAIRLGEAPVAYAGMDNVSIRQNQNTGVWEVKTSESEKELVIYTSAATDEDLLYLKKPPAKEDTEMLLDMATLRSDIKDAIQNVRDSNLTSEQKIEEALAIWRRVYVYDMGQDIKADFPVSDVRVFTSALINKGLGPCGYAAYGAVAVLRAAGIPANVIGGIQNEEFGNELLPDELHGIIQVYNQDKKERVYIEPQIGRISDRYREERALLSIEQVPAGNLSRTKEKRNIDLPVNVRFNLTDPDMRYASGVEITDGSQPLENVALAAYTDESKYGTQLKEVMESILRQQTIGAMLPAGAAALTGGLSYKLFDLINKRMNRQDMDLEDDNSSPKYPPERIAITNTT